MCNEYFSLHRHYFTIPNGENMRKWIANLVSQFHEDPTVNETGWSFVKCFSFFFPGANIASYVNLGIFLFCSFGCKQENILLVIMVSLLLLLFEFLHFLFWFKACFSLHVEDALVAAAQKLRNRNQGRIVFSCVDGFFINMLLLGSFEKTATPNK